MLNWVSSQEWPGLMTLLNTSKDTANGWSNLNVEFFKKPMNTENYSFHPFDTRNCITRLKKELGEYGKLVVGFDFDNTIFDTHARGGDYSNVINLLRRCKDLGFDLCLYTAELREDWLDWKLKFCELQGIRPDYVNESPLIPGTKKPFFSILLDDRAGLESAFWTLKHVVEYAEAKSGTQGKE